MSAPNGATHALESMIWRKDCGPILDNASYYVKVHDTISGQCRLTIDECSPDRLREVIRTASGKVFYYKHPVKFVRLK